MLLYMKKCVLCSFFQSHSLGRFCQGSVRVTFTVASVFVDGVSRLGWGIVEDAFPLPIYLVFFGVHLDLFGSIFDLSLSIT